MSKDKYAHLKKNKENNEQTTERLAGEDLVNVAGENAGETADQKDSTESGKISAQAGAFDEKRRAAREEKSASEESGESSSNEAEKVDPGIAAPKADNASDSDSSSLKPETEEENCCLNQKRIMPVIQTAVR